MLLIRKSTILSKGHNTSGLKIPFISNLKKPACASKRELVTLRYMILETHSILFADEVPEILKKIIFEFMKTWDLMT